MDAISQRMDSRKLLAALRAVAEPTRLRLLTLCAQGELTVSELMTVLGQSQPRVSRHLRLLTNAGLLERFREGSWVFHRVVRDGPAALLARHLAAWLSPDGDEVVRADFASLAAIKQRRSQAAADYFRRNAPRWDEVRSLYVDEREVERTMIDVLGEEPVGDLLDVGTGTARILELLAPSARHAEGIDLSRAMLTIARANLARAGLSNCAVRQADMYALPFAGASFDTVTFHQVLHFADEPGRAIAEAARVLRPGGRLIVVDFAPHEIEALRIEHEHRRLGFDHAEVTAWFEAAGVDAATIRPLPGDPLTVVVWLARNPEQERLRS